MEYFSPHYQKTSYLIVSDKDEFDFIKDYIQDDFDEVPIYDKNYLYEGSDDRLERRGCQMSINRLVNIITIV